MSTFTLGVASNVDNFSPPPAPLPGPGAPPPPLFFYYLFVTHDSLPVAPQFTVSQSVGIPRKNRPATGDFTDVLPSTQHNVLGQAPPVIANPTVAAVIQAQPTAGAVVRVRVTVAGKAAPLKEEEFDLSLAVNSGQVPLALRHDTPPRLSLAINTTFVSPPEAPGDFAAPGPDEVKVILKHIHDRVLDGPGNAWLGIDGLGFGAVQNSEEEAWAQGITEMLLGSPYAGPGDLYSLPDRNGTGRDNVVFMKYLDDSDPGYSICYECQHLVTMAAMTRGLDPAPGTRVVSLFTAGNANGPVATAIGGKIFGTPDTQTVSAALKNDITPGSSWMFDGFENGKPKSNVGAAHIGFALRVFTAAQRLQTFDTGGLNVPGRATGLHVGTMDDPALSASDAVAGPQPAKNAQFGGLFRLPPATDLKKAIDRMRRARPLGFARLLLFNRKDLAAAEAEKANTEGTDHESDAKEQQLQPLYASPLLRMHFDGGTEPANLPYSAYMWSLREHPGNDTICAMWVFYTPRNRLVRLVLGGRREQGLDGVQKLQQNVENGASLDTNARALTIKDMMLTTSSPPSPSAPGKVPRLRTKLDDGFVRPVLDVRSDAGGTVSVGRRLDAHDTARPVKPTKFSNLCLFPDWNATSGSVPLTPADLADVPYFTSG